jgi:HAE1 family hydrophobic/amphiphilic exporter-1
MKLVDLSIKKPVTVSVGAILLLLFGFLSLLRIPIQLTPNVDLPEVSIQTTWTGASPEEVEREVTEVQEKELKSLNGLTEIKSESQDGLSYISLEFEIGTDIDEALLRVSNKMEQVKSYPDNVDRPIIKSGGRFEKAIAWMVLMAEDGYRGNLEEEYDFLDEEVQPWLERLPGISSVNIHGGKKREMQVVVDVDAMASRRITVPDLIRALKVENRTISAGDFDEGKRRYIARTVGEYQSPEDAANVIIRRVEGIPVAVKDVATVRLGHETPAVVVRHDGVTTIVMSAVREPGTNVLLVMDRLKTALAELNGGILKDRHLSIEQVYDETTYIYDAIDLVKKNLMVGSILAVTVLLLFLRNIAGTVVVSAAIPVSVVGTFLFMTLAGRNINVVSLAGLSFAVGMVVDNSIVVFENIFRHREMGKGRIRAAFDGTTEVWGAVLASTGIPAHRVCRRGGRPAVSRHRHRHFQRRGPEPADLDHRHSNPLRTDPGPGGKKSAGNAQAGVLGHPGGRWVRLGPGRICRLDVRPGVVAHRGSRHPGGPGRGPDRHPDSQDRIPAHGQPGAAFRHSDSAARVQHR